MTESIPVWLSLTIIPGCLAAPAGVRIALRRFGLPPALGAAVCYAAGVAVANIAILPVSVVDLLETLASMAVAFWIPLLIIPLGIKTIGRSVARSAAVAGIAGLSLLITGVLACLLFPSTDAGPAQLPALTVALFSGGVPAADQFQQAFHTPARLAAQVQSVATVLTSVFVLVVLVGAAYAAKERPDRHDRAGFGAVLLTVGSAALIVGCGLSIGALFRPGLSSVVGLLTIALLSTAGSLIGRLRTAAAAAIIPLGGAATERSPTVGEYIVLVFALVSGALTSFRQLQAAAGAVWLSAAVVLFGSAAITLITASRLRSIRDTAVSTAASILASAPFAGPAASAARRLDSLPGALAAGLAGYALGGPLARLVLLVLSLFR